MQKKVKVTDYCYFIGLNRQQTYKFVDLGLINKLPAVVRIEKPANKADGLVMLIVDEKKYSKSIELARGGMMRKQILEAIKDIPVEDIVLKKIAELHGELSFYPRKHLAVSKLLEKVEELQRKLLNEETHTQ